MAKWVLVIAFTTGLCASCAQPDVVCPDGGGTCLTHTDATTGTVLTPVPSTTTGGTGSSPVNVGSQTGGTTTTTTATTGGATTTTTGGSPSGGTSTTTTTGGTTGQQITSTLIVDNFSDPNAFAAHQNSLQPPQWQSDNGTMTEYALAGTTLALNCNNVTNGATTCFWYSLLAAQGTCLNISGFTHIGLTVQGAPTADASFQLQNNDTTCTSTSFTGSQNVDLATYATMDNTPHTIYIPLTAFSQVDLVHSRAIAVLNMTQNVPLYLSNIRLVVMQ